MPRASRALARAAANPAVHRDQQEDVLKLLGGAAVGERALDVDAKLIGAAGGGHHRHHGERLGRHRQRAAAPDVAVGVGIDDVLQWRPERAERVHPLLDRRIAEHLPTKPQPFFLQIPRVHLRSPARMQFERVRMISGPSHP